MAQFGGGPGKHDAIQARVWAAASGLEGADATDDIRALRDEDNRLADAADKRRVRRAGDSVGDPDAHGAQLLEEVSPANLPSDTL